MALDLSQTVRQIEQMASRLQRGQDTRRDRLHRLLEVARSGRLDQVQATIEAGHGRPFLAAWPREDMAIRHQPTTLPNDFSVMSVDGSHIDVDRHLPVRCFLINLGGCVITYGSAPAARLYSRPQLYADEQELYLRSDESDASQETPLEGALLGMHRMVQEVQELASLAQSAPPDLPTLALVDGSLVLWGLSGRGYDEFVRHALLHQGLIPAFDRLRVASSHRPLALAAYISLPQSAEVVHTLRLLLCQRGSTACQHYCSRYRSNQEPCSLANGFLDRDIFGALLWEGERSCLFTTSSSVSREHYGDHGVNFYYMNTGQEIARVEVPQWVANDPRLLKLSHSLLVDQCRRGMGYPATIMEAHEQAVIDGADRSTFRMMVDDALGRQRLPVYTSAKNLSKQARWV